MTTGAVLAVLIICRYLTAMVVILCTSYAVFVAGHSPGWWVPAGAIVLFLVAGDAKVKTTK